MSIPRVGTVVLLAAAAAWTPVRTASCPSVLVKAKVAEMIDFDAPPAKIPVLNNVLLMMYESDYQDVTPAELCMRTAFIVIRDVQPIDPANCDVPEELLLRIEGQRGWRVRLGEEWCESVGPFFTSRWHVGDTVYALVYRPGTGAVVRCVPIRCIVREDDQSEAAEPGAEVRDVAQNEALVSNMFCDHRLARLTETLPQMCTLQENLILVLPLGKYMDPRLNEDKQ